MPIGAPPRHTATRNVGLKPLRTICIPSSMESRSNDSAEMKVFSIGGGLMYGGPRSSTEVTDATCHQGGTQHHREEQREFHVNEASYFTARPLLDAPRL